MHAHTRTNAHRGFGTEGTKEKTGKHKANNAKQTRKNTRTHTYTHTHTHRTPKTEPLLLLVNAVVSRRGTCSKTNTQARPYATHTDEIQANLIRRNLI